MKRENQKQVHLMIWEIKPSLRNKNNEISFYLNDLEKVEIGDEIYQRSGVSYSVFKIDEILEIRKGAVSGMNYITAKSSWEIRDNL